MGAASTSRPVSSVVSTAAAAARAAAMDGEGWGGAWGRRLWPGTWNEVAGLAERDATASARWVGGGRAGVGGGAPAGGRIVGLRRALGAGRVVPTEPPATVARRMVERKRRDVGSARRLRPRRSHKLWSFFFARPPALPPPLPGPHPPARPPDRRVSLACVSDPAVAASRQVLLEPPAACFLHPRRPDWKRSGARVVSPLAPFPSLPPPPQCPASSVATAAAVPARGSPSLKTHSRARASSLPSATRAPPCAPCTTSSPPSATAPGPKCWKTWRSPTLTYVWTCGGRGMPRTA